MQRSSGRLAQIQRAEVCKEGLVDEHFVNGEVERLLARPRRARERRPEQPSRNDLDHPIFHGAGPQAFWRLLRARFSQP